MPDSSFQQLKAEIDEITAWYLDETVYCLVTYLGMSQGEAEELVVSSDYFKKQLDDDPLFFQSETGFYWAMLLAGKDFWWHDDQLLSEYHEYVHARHHPP